MTAMCRAGRASWASWPATSMPPDLRRDLQPDIEVVAEQVFAALADPRRRAILAALAADGPATATDLAARLPITRQAIAKHLALLTDAGPRLGQPAERPEGAPRPRCLNTTTKGRHHDGDPSDRHPAGVEGRARAAAGAGEGSNPGPGRAGGAAAADAVAAGREGVCL